MLAWLLRFVAATMLFTSDAGALQPARMYWWVPSTLGYASAGAALGYSVVSVSTAPRWLDPECAA